MCWLSQKEVAGLIRKYSGTKRLFLFKVVKVISYSQTHLGVSHKPDISSNIYTLPKYASKSANKKSESHNTLPHPEDYPTKKGRKSPDFLLAHKLRFPKN